MSIHIELPGERKELKSPDVGVGKFADVLRAELVAEIYVGAMARGRPPAAQTIEAEPDDVLELGWEGGIVELVRAGDLQKHFPETTRSADGVLKIPTQRRVRSATRGSREINLDFTKHLRLKVADEIVTAVAGFAVPKALRLLEQKLIPTTGLHRVESNGNVENPVASPLKGDGPFLVLLHGTFSNTERAFSDLFESSDWKRLVDFYGDRILALEHYTVTESPAGNALELVDKLPTGARLHLLSHSRGGLVGELLCRHPWKTEEVDELFKDPTYEGVQDQLVKLRGTLTRKRLHVDRFMRVAAPAAGTLLASERLDTYLNVILTVLGKLSGPAAPAIEFVKAMATAIVSTRTRADKLPGLESMMPHVDQGFVPFLNLAEPRGTDLAVIAGDVRGGGFFDRVKDFFSHLYYREDNDFVVDSRSMFRGVPRKEAWGFYYRAPRADHFSYFAESETRTRMVDWLTEGRLRDFEPLNAAQPYGGLRGAPASRAIPSLKQIEAKRKGDRPSVFLLPGIMGTHLAARGKRQWLNPFRLAWGGLAKLEIADSDVRRDGLIEMVYERLFDRLRHQHHVIHFGFDWRLSIAESADNLAASIRRELGKHKNPVRIVAHSMGGLVARAFVVAHPKLWEQMKRRDGRLVMLGTPNYGSYVPAQVFTRKHKLIKILAAADLRNSLEELTDVVRTFPGLVEMLPFKDDRDLLDHRQWAGFGKFVPDPGVLSAARAFREKLDTGAVDPDHMIYVAGHAEATPASMERTDREVTFRYTGRGDGTVPWELGVLDGVDTYYVDAEHGQIPNHPPAFDGILELLTQGRTRKLSTTPPVVTRAADVDGLFDVEPEEDIEELRYYPNAADLMATIVGEPYDAEKEIGPPLEIEVTAGHVREAKHPVLIGHYRGDDIVSAESVIDRELGGQLSRNLRLGRYPGVRGTARVFDASDNLKGVVVAGLGEVGSLNRVGLEESLITALTEFALDNLAEKGEPAAELCISSLLIGTYGGTGIGVEDSMAALVNAALTTNTSLEEQDLADRVCIRGIEFIELFLDIATLAGHAAREIAERSAGVVVAKRLVKVSATCRRSRPASPYASGWSRRLRVRKEEDKLKYEFTTDLARSEPYKRSVQWSHVESLLATVTENDREAASTLFQYLLPYQLIEQTSNMPDMVLDLDAASAAIPWEILHPATELSGGREPLGVRVGLLRTLSTPEPRENPRRARSRRALVVGEPAGVKPGLPGARQEGEHVISLLEQHGMKVEPLLEKDAGEIFRALYRHEYDIIHISAHGEFNEPLVDDACNSKKQRHSGVVLGKGRYLTSGEFQNLRAVPSVVFLNCCHLARMEQDGKDTAAPLRNPSRLAASVAEELIKMGVGVVVAAGWAVGDAAAKVFAEFFYRQLLRGETVMSAVRVARKRAYGHGGTSDLTWGAYQVYGDPGTVLHWAESRGVESAPGSRRFVSSHEVVDYVSDFSARSRGIVDDQSLDGFRSELTQIETRLSEEWGGKGEVLTAFGEAYKSLGNYREAIERYRRAIAHSDAPLKTVEQLANLESVQAESLAASDPKAAEKLFEASLLRLDRLVELSPSSERLSLRGATWKRRAKVTKGTANRNKRVSYIRKARRAYADACKLDPPDLYYPLSNKVALDLCLDAKGVKIGDLEAIIRSAEVSDDKWSYATIADAELIRFLAFGKGTAEDTAAGYIRAMNRADIRDSDSMRHQIESLVELALGDPVKKRAAQVLAHLPDTRKGGA